MKQRYPGTAFFVFVLMIVLSLFTACPADGNSEKPGNEEPADSSEPEVLSVTVLDNEGNPVKPQIEAYIGGTVEFGVDVQVKNGASKAVTWSLSGGNGKSVVRSGRLVIAADETDGTVLTVTVTSNADNTKSGSVQVVLALPLPPRYAIEIDETIAGGSVSVEDDLEEAAEGDTITLIVEANDGFTTENVTVSRKTGGDPVAVSDTYTFTMPPDDVTVTATFGLLNTGGIPNIGDVVADKGTLVWHDEFNGTVFDTDKWNIEQGTGSQYGITDWGNNELQYYQSDNISVSNGSLIIESRKQTAGNKNYTSSRITTGQIRNGTTTSSPWVQQKYSVKTGRVEARIKTSKGTGFWPAFWMLGSNSYADVQGSNPVIAQQGWPRCGEIDILEFFGGEEYNLIQTIHFGRTWNADYWPISNTYTYRVNGTQTSLADDWHVYGVVWNNTQLQYYLDDTVTRTIVYSERPTAQQQYLDAFYNDAGFAILFNLAVGGNMGRGTPPDSAFTDGTGRHRLLVDWVRVYE